MTIATPFACRFIRRKCQHEQIFQPSYLRTNRTNHTKIMRCFPHCCPDHRKRSYCGSPLFIQLDQTPQYNQYSQYPPITGDALVAYARFRPLSVAPLAVGDRVAHKSIETVLQRNDPSTGEWIESDLSHSTTDSHGVVSWVFEVNASGRWYYPWSGAATIALRATEHVFEVLVFRRVSTGSSSIGDQLELLASTASSTFRLMSFRRGVTAPNPVVTTASALSPSSVSPSVSASANATTGPPKAQENDTNSDGSPRVSSATLHQVTPTATANKKPTKKRARQDAASPSKPLTDGSAPYSLARAPSPASHSASISASAIPTVSSSMPIRLPSLLSSTRTAPPSFPPTPPPASALGTLLQWLQELPLASSGSRRLSEWEQVVLHACASHQSLARGGDVTLPRQDAGLVPILSALHGLSSSSSSSPMGMGMVQRRDRTASPLDVIDATVRVLLHLFLDVDRLGCAASSSLALDRASLASGYRTWASENETRAQQFVDTKTNASWSDLMATVSTLRSQQQQQLSYSYSYSYSQGYNHPHLESKTIDECFGYRAFVAHTREQVAQQHKNYAEAVRGSYKRPRLQQQQLPQQLPQQQPLPLQCGTPPREEARRWFASDPRVWVSRMEDVAIEMEDGMMAQHTLSLLTVVQFWKHLSCLRLDYCGGSVRLGQTPQLAVASVFNASVVRHHLQCFTRLVLDGQSRWFNCLPSGEATTGTTLMGYVVGDYVGRATRAGTIHITTYLWPSTSTTTGANSSGETASAFAWHWTIDATSLMNSNATVVSVIVETARVQSTGSSLLAFETMAITDKLRCVSRWNHLCQVQFVYRAQ